MSQKNHNPGPVPAENQPKSGGGTDDQPGQDESGKTDAPKSAVGGQEQDEKRRIGEFTGKGEPARRQ